MPKGIIVFGGNGCGKSTLGRRLADKLHYKYIDIEDYYFEKSKVPYSVSRSREECLTLMLEDIEKNDAFVLSAVNGDCGEKINAMYEYAVFMSAPLEVRMERVKKRAYEKYGDRVCKGGNMYEQEKKFYKFVKKRSLKKVEEWANTLTCPIICVDATKPVSDNMEWIIPRLKQ